MKNIRFITILALAMLAGAASCKKENPRGTHEIAAARTLQEKVILSAAQAGATLSDVTATAGDYTVTFHVPFHYEDENKTYESVTLLASEISGVTQDDEKIIFTFVDRATASLYFNTNEVIQIHPRDAQVKGYPGEEKTLDFTITVDDNKYGNKTYFQFLVNEIEARIDFDEESLAGTVTYTVPETETAYARFTVVKDGIRSEKSECTIAATPYQFVLSAEDITVGGKAGDAVEITCAVETDLPEYTLSCSKVEGEFFSVEGNVITVTEDNATSAVREGTIRIEEASGYFEPVIISVSQEILPAGPITTPEGCVVFTDKKMKNAMVAIADSDGDGEVSFDEALQVKEIDIVGKGVQDLTGLETFSNAWKLDARNNDIIDARIVSSLPKLYWLDLNGNPNLEEVDITGCTLIFEHCDFEKTEKLNLTILREQVSNTMWYGITADNITNAWDDRESKDFSQHQTLKCVHQHTKGEGKYPVVISGLGWLDVEINDGTFDRMMNYFVGLFSQHEDIVNYWDYLDVYVYTYISNSRKEFEARYSIEIDEEARAKKQHYIEIHDNILNECYGSIYGDDPACNLECDKKMLILTLDVATNPVQTIAMLYADVSWRQGFSTAIRLRNAMDAAYRLNNIVVEQQGKTLQSPLSNYTFKNFFNKDYNPYDHVMQFFGLPE